MTARIVVVDFVSFDGVIQSPLSPDEDRAGGFEHGGWVLPFLDEALDGFMRDATLGASGMLLGRRTAEILAAAWAEADETEPAVAAMNRMPKHVVSASPPSFEWANTHRLAGDPAVSVAGLKRRAEGELVVFGSGELVQALAEHDLVDELRLAWIPVVLGRGARLFDERAAVASFELVGSGTTPRGVVIVRYRRGGGAPAGARPRP